ncbi:chromate transporter [Klebsormidium nitens]|uniref:Chromate transporter n=1 Tax=Klebsormidium nitens TaxID=105231 RepID=A0A1Y1I6L9_KLENI|nr:chromate transporter [Klebsormidium nitens]|eukprot:GAQ86163.1 chromate transporter [Klebsormidium nitens]
MHSGRAYFSLGDGTTVSDHWGRCFRPFLGARPEGTEPKEVAASKSSKGRAEAREGEAPQLVDEEVANLLEGENDGPRCARIGYWEILKSFCILGWTAFGGPAAHIAQFHKAFVEREPRWMSDGVFVELLALGTCLPGPTSTQMSFAIGIVQKGIPGGLLSGLLFQYPGLVMMSLVGVGAGKFLVHPAGWLTAFSAGLSAVAVALVADAAFRLSKKLCDSRVTVFCCGAAAAVTYYYQSQWIFPTLIFAGGLLTIISERHKELSVSSSDCDVNNFGLSMRGGAALLSGWLALLILVVVGKHSTSYHHAKFLHWFESFYVTGSIIFGGGQVVLPIIEQQVVHYNTVCTPAHAFAANATFGAPSNGCVRVESPDTWVTEQQFLAGLAVAQAMPGPLFNFAAYLGAIMGGVPGIVACWLGLFAPGIMLIYGVLPFWAKFRKWPWYRRALPGFNATAIGLIYASVFQLGLKAFALSPFPNASIVIGIVGYCATAFFEVPAPVAILTGGVLGVVGWATNCH